MAKILAAGKTVEVSTDSGSTWTRLDCQVRRTQGPDATTPEIDTTSLCSTVQESVGGLPDYGSYTLEGYYDPANTGVALLESLFYARTDVDWRVTYTDTGGSVKTFDGYVQSFSESGGVGEVETFSAVVKITSQPTIT